MIQCPRKHCSIAMAGSIAIIVWYDICLYGNCSFMVICSSNCLALGLVDCWPWALEKLVLKSSGKIWRPLPRRGKMYQKRIWCFVILCFPLKEGCCNVSVVFLEFFFCSFFSLIKVTEANTWLDFMVLNWTLWSLTSSRSFSLFFRNLRGSSPQVSATAGVNAMVPGSKAGMEMWIDGQDKIQDMIFIFFHDFSHCKFLDCSLHWQVDAIIGFCNIRHFMEATEVRNSLNFSISELLSQKHQKLHVEVDFNSLMANP